MRMRKSHGFTLVEVLAAMAIIALVLPVAMRGISLATRLGGEARHRSEAAELARLKLYDLTSGGTRNGGLGGDFGADWPDYRWTATLQTWNGNTTLEQLDVTVTWSDGRGQRSLVMSTLINPQFQ